MTRDTIREIEFGVDGMMCGACVARVEKKLNKIEGVEDATVNLATERAKVSLDTSVNDVSALLDSVKSAGYEARTDTLKFKVDGMTCGACVARVEKKLGKLEGVIDATVNLTTERAKVSYVPGLVDQTRLFESVEKAGYTAVALEDANRDTDDSPSEADRLKKALIVAAAFTIPLFAIAMLHMVPSVGRAMDMIVPARVWLVFELLLAVPVQFYAGWRFYTLGRGEIKHFAPGMNSLVMLGSNAAFFYYVRKTPGFAGGLQKV